ncbi:MAG: M48 family peptidase [Burkholderiaceae bacterium]|nr:MAG: M48 family peptidase [Burkholderiaceae bacterium]
MPAHAKLRSPRSDPAQLSLLFDLPGTPIAPVAPAPPIPPAPARPKDAREIALGAQTISYLLKRSPRKSIGFQISDDGLRVTAPRWIGLHDIEQSIREKERWILTKLAAWKERSTRRALPSMQWASGATIPFLGAPLTIELGASQSALAEIAGQRILQIAMPQHASPQQIKDRVQAWLQGEARRIFESRLEHYLALSGWRISGWGLSSATTQWGSCTAQGHVRLNWRLIHFTQDIIDYVIAHELAHLKEMNHSPRFWQTVASLYPDYHNARKALRHQHPELLPELF